MRGGEVSAVELFFALLFAGMLVAPSFGGIERQLKRIADNLELIETNTRKSYGVVSEKEVGK